jgi:hypothetical protein
MSATSYLPPDEYGGDPTQTEYDSQSPDGPAIVEIRPLSVNEIKGIVQREIEDSLGGLGSQVSEQQRLALRYYYGRPLGNEIQDRSQVVMRDVLEVVEWTMPSLMRMFSGGSQIVRFMARNAEQQENADNATSYINYLWEHKIDGFQVLHDTFKTGLIEKNGFIKVYWEEKRTPRVETYQGLTEEQLMVLLDDDDVEPVTQPDQPNEDEPLFDIQIRRWHIEKGIKLDTIPPEEMLVARRMIRLNDESQFTAQRKKYTVSSLVAMGFDFNILARVPSDDMPEYSMGRTERLSEDETYPVTTAERRDAAAREIWTTDCYIKIDEDGDGYAELRRILIVGEHATTILEDVEIASNPFISMTPVPVPHKFYGLSLADLVLDLQMIRSTIMRQILDHIYLSNNPRLGIVEGMVEIEDLLSVRPGGIVRMRAPGQIEPIMLPPLPREAFESLQYLEDVRSNRTGVMAHGREMDASAINSTATGMAQLMAEKQQKIELIGRIYANALKDLFRKMLRLVIENNSKEEQIKINGEWITINPGEWDTEMDLEIQVGLGAGQAVERINNLEKIQANQQAHWSGGGANYTVTPKNLWESSTRLSEAAGFKNKDLFFQNPDGQEPPQPPPDPDLKRLELDAMKAEADIKQKMAELELDAQREMHLVSHRQAELESQERTKMADIAMRERLGLGQQEATIEAAEINADVNDEGEGEKE